MRLAAFGALASVSIGATVLTGLGVLARLGFVAASRHARGAVAKVGWGGSA